MHSLLVLIGSASQAQDAVATTDRDLFVRGQLVQGQLVQGQLVQDQPVRSQPHPDQPSARASFRISTSFSDNNPAEVTAYISCSAGTAQPEYGMISEGSPLEFVISGFPAGRLRCLLAQAPAPGYQPAYYAFDDASGHSENDPDGCQFLEFEDGDAGFCEVENTLVASNIEVRRLWVDPGSDINITIYDEAHYSCDSEAWGEYEGSLWFSGKDDRQVFEVLPDWEGGTLCAVWPIGNDGSVEYDPEECLDLQIRPGASASCTIFNTRLFDADQPARWYGWLVMALIVLLVGFIAARQWRDPGR